MKVFTAIESLHEDGDFSFTVPGELVHFPPIVCADRECGCERSMGGLVSRKATTCFVVRHVDMDADAYTDLLFTGLSENGWVTGGNEEDRVWVEEWAAEHMEIAAGFPAERPLRLRHGHVMLR